MFRVIFHLDMDASLLRAIPLARELKQRIYSERQLTATIGVAANKLLAKIASDHQKPDGLTLVSEKQKVQFLRPLPVRALYGVGKVTEGILNRAGVETVGDLQDCGSRPQTSPPGSSTVGWERIRCRSR